MDHRQTPKPVAPEMTVDDMRPPNIDTAVSFFNNLVPLDDAGINWKSTAKFFKGHETGYYGDKKDKSEVASRLAPLQVGGLQSAGNEKDTVKAIDQALMYVVKLVFGLDARK